MIKESYSARYHRLKLHIISQFFQYSKNKKSTSNNTSSCKKSDISIIISVNENIQMSNKSAVSKK